MTTLRYSVTEAPATAESTSSWLFSIVGCRGRKASKGKGPIVGFDDIIGATGALRTYSERTHKQIEFIPTEVMEILVGHSWPGNIRELQNFIERSVLLTDGNTRRPPPRGLRQNAEIDFLKPLTLKQAERHHICKTLEQADWVIGGPRGAAVRLGLKRPTLYARTQRLGISRANQIAENRIFGTRPQMTGHGETWPPNGRLTGETTNLVEVLCDEKGQRKVISCRV
jgi:hypothetical protein